MYTHMHKDTVDGDDAKADAQSYWYQMIFGATFVEILGQRPRGRISIVRLYGSTAPRCVAITVHKELAIVVHNGDHDGVIDKTSQDSTIDLSKEHGTGRNFDCIDESASAPKTVKKNETYDIHPSSGHWTS